MNCLGLLTLVTICLGGGRGVGGVKGATGSGLFVFTGEWYMSD